MRFDSVAEKSCPSKTIGREASGMASHVRMRCAAVCLLPFRGRTFDDVVRNEPTFREAFRAPVAGLSP